MHIVEKILSEIQEPLESDYNINVDPDDWKSFKEPLTNKIKFENRQKESLEIIKKILDVHGKKDIVRFLGKLASIEPQIQKLQPNVRDHIVHAINTFLIGVYILKKVNFPQSNATHTDYRFMWKLCGPTHDLGYPIEFAHNLKKPFVDEMNGILDESGSLSPKLESEIYPKGLETLCGSRDANEIIQERLTQWELDINIEDYYKWLKRGNEIDHGVISALSQLKVIEAMYNKEYPRRENSFDFNQRNFDLDMVSASSALFIHNISQKYSGFSNKIKFDLSPLAFLLFLCDTFQEWDRDSGKENGYSGENFDIICSNNEILLSVPEKIKCKISTKLSKRLSGLLVKVNKKVAVEYTVKPSATLDCKIQAGLKHL